MAFQCWPCKLHVDHGGHLGRGNIFPQLPFLIDLVFVLSFTENMDALVLSTREGGNAKYNIQGVYLASKL